MREIRVTIEALHPNIVGATLAESVVLLDGDDLVLGDVEQAIEDVVADAWPESEED